MFLLILNIYYFQLSNSTIVNDRVVTHNGLIGMLEANEIDIALTDLSLTYQRGKVCNS